MLEFPFGPYMTLLVKLAEMSLCSFGVSWVTTCACLALLRQGPDGPQTYLGRFTQILVLTLCGFAWPLRQLASPGPYLRESFREVCEQLPARRREKINDA